MNKRKNHRYGSLNVAKLRELRLSFGWTQAQLDGVAKVGYRTTANAEAGENISVATLRAFAKALGVHPSYFLD